MSGLRLVLAARKSRKVTDDDLELMFERQDVRAKEWAERGGDAIIHTTTDVKSGTSAPWTRKQLGPWMRDPDKLALYDGILISETDRISRGNDEDWHWLENWCYVNGKRIVVADGPQFPPREGPMGESDRYQWIATKRAARTYWEAVRDKQAGGREIIEANGGAIGRAPFGYAITGEKYHKQFVPHEVRADIVRQAFQRIADGQSGLQVSKWIAAQTGRAWRNERTMEMIRRTSYYRGERDGHLFEPLVSEELWQAANNALDGRKTARRGRSVKHGYSGLLYCQCGERYYRHAKTDRGNVHYRCRRGRQGVVTEERCPYGAPLYDAANFAVDELMRRCNVPERIITTTGGDHARKAELKALQEAMESAMRDGQMDEVTTLAARFKEVSDRPAEPIVTKLRNTGRTYAAVWTEATEDDRRALLSRGDFKITLIEDSTGWHASLQWEADLSRRSVELHKEAGLELIETYFDLVRLLPA